MRAAFRRRARAAGRPWVWEATAEVSGQEMQMVHVAVIGVLGASGRTTAAAAGSTACC